MIIKSFSNCKFPVGLIDCPWLYYGNPNKDQAAGKHYPLMTDEEIFNLPVYDVLENKCILFVWATSPRLDCAIDAIRKWGLYYRGIAFDWCKTNAKGFPINGQGARPSLIKHAGELVLWASKQEKGRPLPVKDEGMASWIFDFGMPDDMVMEPRPQNVHSRKPETVQDRIERLLDGPYIEIFARRQREGWECFGNEIEKTEFQNQFLEEMMQMNSEEYKRMQEMDIDYDLMRKETESSKIITEWQSTSEPFMRFEPIKNNG